MKENKGKGKWRLALPVFTMFVMVMAFCLPVYAGVADGEDEYEVYPTPQSMTYEDGSTTLTDQVTVKTANGIDSYTQKRLDDTLKVLNLKKVDSGNGNTKLTVGIYNSGDEADQYGKAHGAKEEVFGKFDAYTLWVDNGQIVILGKNTDAAYYGVSTLKRIFEQLDGKSIRNLKIEDYAEIEFRGFIEGYYGNPWSHEDRMDLMKYGGEIKMNQYVYAPKDDPMHNAQWRTLYDEEGLKRVAELAKAGNESKCFFVYALHPFQNDPLTAANYDSSLEILKQKFAQVIEAGVRQIAILEDDASANGRWTADTLVKLLNDMTDWLIEKKKEYPDLKTDVLFCPGWMAYANAMTDVNNDDVIKIKAIHEGVYDSVRIIMTGGRVWGKVSNEFADNFYNRTNETSKPGRYPYLWMNWPCNDNTHNSLIMGGHNYMLQKGVDGKKYQGVILNPMQDSEPSKVGIFTAADYCWNIWQTDEEGDQAWEDSFKYIDHMTPMESEESLALKEIAKHMIAQSEGQASAGKTGVMFEESVEIKDDLADFSAKLDEGSYSQEDISKMRQIFKTINDALKFYLEKGTNRRMAAQLTPYASSLRDVTQADLYLFNALEKILNNDKSAVYDPFSKAQADYDLSQTYGFRYVNTTQYGQGGRRYIKPFTEKLMSYVSEKVVDIVNPEFVEAEYKGSLSHACGTVYQGSLADLSDGNDTTFIWFGKQAAVGDYVQSDLGKSKTVGEVRIVLGAGDADKWNSYHLEYSEDGENWESTEGHTGVSSGQDVYLVDLKGASARYIRIVNDTNKGNWVKFAEFSVYAPVEGMVYTNTADAGWQEEYENDRFSLLPKQNASLKPGEYIGLKLDRIHEVANVAVTGLGTEKLVLEMAMNTAEWKQGKTGPARYIRLMNKGNADVSFQLDSFVVSTKEFLPIDFFESNIGNQSSTEDARTTSTSKNWVDGNLSTAAKYCAPPSEGSYVIYDLGQEVDIRALKVWTRVNTYDYPRAAKFQASLSTGEDADWKDILVIDGDSSNTTFSTSPELNGWTPGTGAVEVDYAYREAQDITPVKARYLRLYFTAANGGRWVELYEIEINNGEYIPSINDPTFETNVPLQKGITLQSINDNDLTTAFYPAGSAKGSLIYHLSDEKKVNKINILQSGSNISNATVSIRTGADTWNRIGTLDRSFAEFNTSRYAHVYDVKVEWDGSAPAIYEIITLDEQATIDIENAKEQLSIVKAELQQAKNALAAVASDVAAAEGKVNAAVNTADKLRAEIELQKLYAKRAEAEAVVAEKSAVVADREADVAKAEAKKFEAENDKDNAAAKEIEAQAKLQEANNLRTQANNKRGEKLSFEQAAQSKQVELDKLLNTPPAQPDNPKPEQPQKPQVKNFKSKTYKYKVISASAKTVAVIGPVKKNITAVSIPATVKYKGITYKVVQIGDNAFKNCKKLRTLKVGGNVTQIGRQAFAGCERLKSINLQKATKIKSFGNKAFQKIYAKAKIKVPAKQLKSYKNALKKAGIPKRASVKK